MKRSIKTLLLRLLWLAALVSAGPVHSQTDEIKNAMESIARLTGGSGSNRTTQLLSRAGFTIPESLKGQWNALPAYRQVETAYWAAEKMGDGRKFIGALTAFLKEEFESVFHERPLQAFTEGTGTVRYGSLLSLELPAAVPREIRQAILSITNYTDGRALGGTRGILKYYFNLPDDEVYSILRESGSNAEALIKGIMKASIPPSQKDRLINIVTELFENYESAKLDKRLSDLIDNPSDMVRPEGGTPLLDERQKVRVKNDYDQLLQNTTAPGSKKFRYMKIDPDGFGGVILGNKVSARKSVGRLKNVVWIHEDAAGGSKTGRLEFIFHDSATKILPGVLWEDVYAAYNIIFVENKHSLFDREEGIGLVSGTYPKVYNEDRVFDSLVMSHGLTENEINYYKFLCNFQQLFTPLSLKIKNDDQRLTELDALYEEAAAKGDLSARNTIRSEYNNILEERQRAYSEYSLLSPIYRDSLAYWKTHYSMVVKNVHNYISKCNKIIIHPAIANLELGRCLVRADVHPRAGLQMLDRIKGTGIDQTKLELLRNWLSGTDSVGWKFTDDSLLISATGGIVLVTRKNNPASAESRAGLLNFNKINVKGAKVTSTDFTEFYKMFPLLVRNYYDYHRLNNFTKLMAIFRWAKRSKASFLNKPQAPPMYNAPGYIKITDEGSVKIIDMYPCR